MHPLEVSLDESSRYNASRRQGGEARRRSSLDNSCLGAALSFQHVIASTNNHDEEFAMSASPRRRLSLNGKETTAVTFLATVCQEENRPKLDLDADFHTNSVHRSRPLSTPTKSGHSTTVSMSSNPSCSFGDNDDSESSLESDADSFCDASVQEPANKEYLRKDLGASCFIDGCFLDFNDIVPPPGASEPPVSTQIITEGVEFE